MIPYLSKREIKTLIGLETVGPPTDNKIPHGPSTSTTPTSMKSSSPTDKIAVLEDSKNLKSLSITKSATPKLKKLVPDKLSLSPPVKSTEVLSPSDIPPTEALGNLTCNFVESRYSDSPEDPSGGPTLSQLKIWLLEEASLPPLLGLIWITEPPLSNPVIK